MNPFAQAFSKLKSDFSQAFGKKKPVTPLYPTPTGAPPSVPSFATPTSMTGTGQVGPLAPKPAVTPTAPKVTPTSPTFTPMAVPEVKDDRDAQGLLINPPGALFDRNTGLRIGGETPQDDRGGDSAPPAPTISPESTKALELAQSAYERSLNISPEELSTQGDLDRLIESTNKGYQAIKDKVIPMEFITGQLRSTEQRALNLAQPLEAKLARLQAARTASLEASKFALSRIDKQLETERGTATTARAEAESARRFNEQQSLAQDKFEEDKRQFGIEYALEQQKANVPKPLSQAQETAEIAKTEKQQATQQQSSLAIGNINSLLSGDRYKAISGAIQTGSIPFLGDRAAVAEYNQLTGILKLGIRGLIKGQGQVSDYEGRILAEASSSLSRLTNESQMKEALLKARGVLQTNNGLETKVIVKDTNGKVIGQGELNGQDIFEAVNDGNTVEYIE